MAEGIKTYKFNQVLIIITPKVLYYGLEILSLKTLRVRQNFQSC